MIGLQSVGDFVKFSIYFKMSTLVVHTFEPMMEMRCIRTECGREIYSGFDPKFVAKFGLITSNLGCKVICLDFWYNFSESREDFSPVFQTESYHILMGNKSTLFQCIAISSKRQHFKYSLLLLLYFSDRYLLKKHTQNY
jgi:hypothetical protein